MSPTSAAASHLSFDAEAPLAALHAASDDELDALDYGVIGFDDEGLVRRYNRFESQAAALSPERVLGRSLFKAVAPCMNNALVAQRFHDAMAGGRPLDATIDYLLALRLRPVKVRLRLLDAPSAALRYVLVERAT